MHCRCDFRRLAVGCPLRCEDTAGGDQLLTLGPDRRATAPGSGRHHRRAASPRTVSPCRRLCSTLVCSERCVPIEEAANIPEAAIPGQRQCSRSDSDRPGCSDSTETPTSVLE